MHPDPLTIAVSAAPFTLINTFEVLPENQGALIAALSHVTEKLTRGLPGFVGVAIHLGLDGRHVINYVQWKTRGDFTAALQTETMKQHMADVQALALSIRPVFCSPVYVCGQAHQNEQDA